MRKVLSTISIECDNVSGDATLYETVQSTELCKIVLKCGHPDLKRVVL
ncbi:MAG: hypothetical protein ACRCUY_12365 [Thermoguttaceae bacterium]